MGFRVGIRPTNTQDLEEFSVAWRKGAAKCPWLFKLHQTFRAWEDDLDNYIAYKENEEESENENVDDQLKNENEGDQ